MTRVPICARREKGGRKKITEDNNLEKYIHERDDGGSNVKVKTVTRIYGIALLKKYFAKSIFGL